MAFTPNEEIRQELTAVVESEAYVTDSRYIVKICDELEKRSILFKGEGCASSVPNISLVGIQSGKT